MTRMQTNPTRQTGMTTLGLLILLVFIGIFLYAGVRLLPVYLEDLKIAGTFKSLEQEFSGGANSKVAIEKSIGKRFDVESVNVIASKDIKIRKTSRGYDVSIDYTNKQPFLFNIYFAVDFSHRVSLER
ncbi:MAG: DUF4845 domain-containing protein [Pseudomonadota bacterium]